MRSKINLKNTLFPPLPPFQDLPLLQQQHWETGNGCPSQLIMSCFWGCSGMGVPPLFQCGVPPTGDSMSQHQKCAFYTSYILGMYRDTHQWVKKKKKKHYCFLLLSIFVSNKLNLTHTGKKNSNSSCPISSAKSCLQEKFNCYYSSDPFIVLAYRSFLTPKMARGE